MKLVALLLIFCISLSPIHATNFKPQDFKYSGVYTDRDYRNSINYLKTMTPKWSFEKCMSAIGVFCCKVAVDLEKRTGKPMSVVHRDLLSRALFESYFKRFNEEVIRNGHPPLNIKNHEIIHKKIALYTEYFYRNGFFRKHQVVIGEHVVWMDIELDEMESICFGVGFAGACIAMFPHSSIAMLGASLFAGSVVKYLEHQADKQKNKRKGGTHPRSMPPQRDIRLTSSFQT